MLFVIEKLNKYIYVFVQFCKDESFTISHTGNIAPLGVFFRAGDALNVNDDNPQYQDRLICKLNE